MDQSDRLTFVFYHIICQLLTGIFMFFNQLPNIIYFQFYWLFNALAVANLLDVLFCSFVIFACEQLSHLKEIMKPLMELSAALGSAPTNEVYRLPSATEEVSQTGEQGEGSSFFYFL